MKSLRWAPFVALLLAVGCAGMEIPALGAEPIAPPSAQASVTNELADVRLLVPGDPIVVRPGAAAARLLARAPRDRIPGLSWTSVDREPIVRPDGHGDFRFFANVHGAFPRDGRTLAIQGQRIALNTRGEFVASLPITAEAQAYRVTAVDLHGRAQEQMIVIEVPAWKKALMGAGPQAKAPFSLITIGMGYASYRYQESGVGPFSESALAAKISFQRQFTAESRWDLGLNTFFTAVPFSTSDPQARTVSFFGLNARIGYHTRWLPEPWSFSLMGGVYYLTTSTSNGTFGFQNLTGPQFFPVLRRRFNNGGALALYAKYAPVASGIDLQPSNYEVAAGLAVAEPLGGLQLSFALDCALLSAVIEGDDFQNRTLSFGVSLGF